jgi:flagellar basal body rod protein FlgB
MSIFNTRMFAKLKGDLKFIREAQTLTANNIARVHSPGAQPLKLERTSFRSALELCQPNQGQGFSANHMVLSQFNAVIDKDSQTEAVPGESQISIENESVRMAELDDQHLLTLGLKKSWGKAFRSIISG